MVRVVGLEETHQELVVTTCVCSTIRPKQCNRVQAASSSSDCQLAVICHPVPPPHTATSAHTVHTGTCARSTPLCVLATNCYLSHVCALLPSTIPIDRLSNSIDPAETNMVIGRHANIQRFPPQIINFMSVSVFLGIYGWLDTSG